MPITVRTPRISASGQPIVVDVTELRALARDLRRASREAHIALRTGMRTAARVVGDDARSRTGYSKRIPGSIKESVGLANFKVSAGGDSAPNASPIENKGRGDVRHPVFLTYAQAHSGSSKYIKRWTEKNSPPAFLEPALHDNADRVAQIVGDSIESAVRTAIEGKK